jgi:alkylglycerol monooxygenase
MFGTFKAEEEEPVYGALTPIESYNPNRIYFHYWSFLWQDARATKKVWDKIRIWFMPLGWRPEDRRGVYRKRVKAEDLVKFDIETNPLTKKYLMFQMAVGLGLMFVIINLKWPLELTDRLGLTAILWLMISNWGGVLEKKNWAVSADLLFIILLNSACMFLVMKFELSYLSPMVFLLTIFMLTAHIFWKRSGALNQEIMIKQWPV